jgi:hypothetical protein
MDLCVGDLRIIGILLQLCDDWYTEYATWCTPDLTCINLPIEFKVSFVRVLMFSIYSRLSCLMQNLH